MKEMIEILKAREQEELRNAAEAQEVAEAYRRIRKIEEVRLQRGVTIPQKTEPQSQEAEGLPETPNKTQIILAAIRSANGVTLDDLSQHGQSVGIKRQYIHGVIFKLKERGLVTQKRNRFYPAMVTDNPQSGSTLHVQ